jgi:hypothetical protein
MKGFFNNTEVCHAIHTNNFVIEHSLVLDIEIGSYHFPEISERREWTAIARHQLRVTCWIA